MTALTWIALVVGGMVLAWLLGATILRFIHGPTDATCRITYAAATQMDSTGHSLSGWLTEQRRRHGLTGVGWLGNSILVIFLSIFLVADYYLMYMTFDSIFSTSFLGVKASLVLAFFAVALPFVFGILTGECFRFTRFMDGFEDLSVGRRVFLGILCAVVLVLSVALQIGAAQWRADELIRINGLDSGLRNWFGLLAGLCATCTALCGLVFGRFLAGLLVGTAAVFVYAPIRVASFGAHGLHHLSEMTTHMLDHGVYAAGHVPRLITEWLFPRLNDRLNADWNELRAMTAPCGHRRVLPGPVQGTEELKRSKSSRLSNEEHDPVETVVVD